LTPEVVSLATLRAQYGTATPTRQFLFERLATVINLLHETGHVRRIYLFGSFATETPVPNDVDLFVVMSQDFTTALLSQALVDVFTHDMCRIRYNVDVFWVTEAVGENQIEAVLSVFSVNRNRQPQPILEVKR